MFVQWCVKGIHGNDVAGISGISEKDAAAIIDDGIGILCRWWQNAAQALSVADLRAGIRRRLTMENLERHLHDYDNVGDQTAFISLSAGCVEREAFLGTNLALPARVTALDFATHQAEIAGYLYVCWVIVAMNPAADVEGLAEEVRELSTYRRYSEYHREGEVTAKLCVPSNQINYWEKWVPEPYDAVRLAHPEVVPYYEGDKGWVKAFAIGGGSDWVEAGAVPVEAGFVPLRVLLERHRVIIDRGPPKKLLRRERVQQNQRDFTDPIRILNLREMIDDERPYP
jgi:hypothetical protein